MPPSGQAWTTLDELRGKHHNTHIPDPVNTKITSIATEPKFGIGQRAILIETPNGNVLWDCIALLDQATVDLIKSKGGLKGIVISHPHFYTTNAVWAKAFKCPVYVASEDADWLYSKPADGELRVVQDVNTEIVPGLTAIKCGGHFPGSFCLHYDNMLFSSDTIMTIASSHNPEEHYTPGHTQTYAFMWAIPNMIPLDPKTIQQVLKRLEPFDFTATFGNIPGSDLRKHDLKRRVLESAKIQVSRMGWEGKEEGDAVLRQYWD